ncbi:MAG: hypothetical protein R8G34_03725 [Paracoccaceae bacterium]|nr:hypothetical protein [Paracoccaceae bacterium]
MLLTQLFFAVAAKFLLRHSRCRRSSHCQSVFEALPKPSFRCGENREIGRGQSNLMRLQRCLPKYARVRCFKLFGIAADLPKPVIENSAEAESSHRRFDASNVSQVN